MVKYALRFGVLGYLALLLVVPVGMVGYRTFEHGFSPVWHTLRSHDAVQAIWLSLLITAIAVPVNVVFGVGTGWLLARRKMPLPWLVNAVINLPFAMSPVIIGLSVYVLYGRTGWIGTYLFQHDIPVLFTWKAMVIATIFVSLPFVVREVVPVLEELGTDQEQAAEVLGASRLQAFWRVTLPAIRWAVIYGTILTVARALGEYGAVNLVSSNIVGQSLTLPLYVDNRVGQLDPASAYTAGLLLAVISLLILVGMTTLSGRRRRLDVEVSE
ncbi:MAG TPA: sulfate ABC transporter permease subunit [Mycobacteriales bacterium]|nr:sulfate ABC transporter permease subunit [Mycobacteriales bacterium]